MLMLRQILITCAIGVFIGSFLRFTVDFAEAGKAVGETPTYMREQGYEERFFYVASGNGVGQIEFQSWAQPNSLTSASRWRIRRFTYNSDNVVTAIEWAGGDDLYNQILDDRVTLSY